MLDFKELLSIVLSFHPLVHEDYVVVVVVDTTIGGIIFYIAACFTESFDRFER